MNGQSNGYASSLIAALRGNSQAGSNSAYGPDIQFFDPAAGYDGQTQATNFFQSQTARTPQALNPEIFEVTRRVEMTPAPLRAIDQKTDPISRIFAALTPKPRPTFSTNTDEVLEATPEYIDDWKVGKQPKKGFARLFGR